MNLLEYDFAYENFSESEVRATPHVAVVAVTNEARMLGFLLTMRGKYPIYARGLRRKLSSEKLAEQYAIQVSQRYNRMIGPMIGLLHRLLPLIVAYWSVHGTD